MVMFGVPYAVSAYGSTEAAGVSHLWGWRRGEDAGPVKMSAYGGQARRDLDWKLTEDGEIAVRGKTEGVIFSGYRRGTELIRPIDDAGWFLTGDLGQIDASGNLVFRERVAESVRVNGEYVPLDYVEERFGAIDGIDEVAAWRRDSHVGGQEVVLFIVAASVPADAIRAVADELPKFMRPAAIVRVADLPRDTGVQKVRELWNVHKLDEISLV
jgi:carnitine-CoA ligase